VINQYSTGIHMLSLESDRWSELTHAYGSASDIPSLLVRLNEESNEDREKELWFSLWSALAHQGDVYSASFAAVPHVIDVIARAPNDAGSDHFHFPAWIEICRAAQGVDIPEDLEKAYFESIAKLPSLVASSSRPWGAEFAACAMSAVAAAKGHHAIAEALLEFGSENVAEEFLARRSAE
jgi:hypothetical protein